MNHSVIFNPFTPIPKHPKSHVRGWSMAWADRLGADIADLNTDLTKYRTMYLDFGVNFSGAINLFGGFNDEVFDRCNNMLDAIKRGSELVLLDSRPTNPNISEPRIGKASSSRRLTRRWATVFDMVINRASVISMHNLIKKSAIIGDSHTTAFASSSDAILRRNGVTLHSFISAPLEFIRNYNLNDYEHITMCLGSVDIRFHLVGRNDRELPKKLAQAYGEAVKKVREHHKFIPIYVCAPVPVEYEGRRIPKSGHYKGVPFNGSREARLEYTLKFRRELYQRFDAVISPPNDWYYMDGEQYANEIMELGSSVHIAPTCYRSILKWSPHV